jgi:type IV pilus assembly protein PilQ
VSMSRTLTAWVGLAAIMATTAPAQGPPAATLEAKDTTQRATLEATASSQQQAVTVNDAGLFDAHLRSVPLPEAMRMLSVQARRNIAVSASVTATVTADLYQLTFEEALDALLAPGGYSWVPRGKFVYVCTPQEQAAVRNAGRAQELRIFELSFIPAADVLPVVTGLLSQTGMVTSTTQPKVEGVALTAEDFDAALNDGLGGRSRAVGEFLVVRDFPERLDEIADVIAKLDRRPRQVLVEATILRARLSENNALGVDFNALAGIDFRSIGSTSTGGTDLVPGALPDYQLDNATGATTTAFGAEVPAGGLTFGLITNNVAMFIRALEEIVDVTIIANPKVLAVNEQLGRVIVGRQDGYLTTTVTETAAIQTVEFIETGTQILFRPFIANDGTIRMDIHPEDSSGGLTTDNLPYKDTTEVTTNVLIEDGHTLVIGGLFREVTTSSSAQVPWLGNVPIVGALFRGRNDNAVREEVIVLITPHIIDGGADDDKSAWALEEVEHRRVLAHRGLMPWGRERLAQAHYRWALEHHGAGRVDNALWDLDMALSLNPRFVEADWLREELTQTSTQEPDNSVIHNLVRQMIEEELSREEDAHEPASHDVSTRHEDETGEASEPSHEDE